MHLRQARRRLIFEELFLLKTGQLLLKSKNKIAKTEPLTNTDISEFYSALPFTLTDSQKNAINECLKDMKTSTPMNRLLQGDVGCGKTAVAAALIFAASKNNKPSVLMAPTGILAFQHYNTLCTLLPSLNIALLVGSTPKKQKDKIKKDFAAGEIDLIVGTHAVITEKADITGAALVITDEQHRFGVKQRATLGTKAGNPHTLYMSATPIPRTLGLVIYGELDISV
ncbi:MAG: DEAD/DEAH box helicase, partial [Thermoguttaceae bacterium]|nr:DEAD/DEAH box helicase [Thermoguttaceae bacterium]